MRMEFLAKYRESGLLTMQVSLGAADLIVRLSRQSNWATLLGKLFVGPGKYSVDKN